MFARLMGRATLIFQRLIRDNSKRYLGTMLASVIALSGSSALLAAPPEIVQLKPRGDAVQSYWLMREDAPVKAIAVLLSGGYGLLKLRQTESGITWDQAGAEFLVNSRDRFLDHETAVAIIDTPSDEVTIGLVPKFRKSDKHVADIRAVVGDLGTRFPGAKIFLVGNSMGTISAAYVGAALGKSVDGVILTASVFEWTPSSWRFLYDSNLSDFDFARIQVPLLVVHHVDDKCVATPFASTQKLAGKYPLMVVRGGEPVRDNGCGPLGPHGFLGREGVVVTEIKNWMHGRPANLEIN